MITNHRSCYLGGPMRGFDKYNFPAFEEAEIRLKALGLHVISPHRMDLDKGFDPNGGLEGFDLNDCVKRDINAIIETECVVFLPGWHKSVGARAEKTVADWLSRPCYDYPSLEPIQVPETILEEAQRLVYGDRGAFYGPPERDFARTGTMWGPIIGDHKGNDPIPPDKVGLCMIALKISREVNKHKPDNLIDVCGYAACVQSVSDHSLG